MANSYRQKCEILGSLWLDFRGEEQFEDFIETNDLGLPMAYCISEELLLSTPKAEEYVNETWNALIEFLDADPMTEYESIDDLIMQGNT